MKTTDSSMKSTVRLFSSTRTVKYTLPQRECFRINFIFLVKKKYCLEYKILVSNGSVILYCLRIIWSLCYGLFKVKKKIHDAQIVAMLFKSFYFAGSVFQTMANKVCYFCKSNLNSTSLSALSSLILTVSLSQVTHVLALALTLKY